MTNGRIAAVVRRKGRAVELYSLSPSRPAMRASLRPIGADGGVTAVSAVRPAANTPSAASVEATFLTAGGTERVLRGGSWRSGPEGCRSSARSSEPPGFGDVCFGYEAYGFRCVRRAPGAQATREAHPEGVPHD